MANFPTSLPSFTNPSGGDYQNSPAHATLHATANDEISAVAAKVGITGSAVITSLDYKVTPRMITLTDGATVTVDLSKRGINTVTLGGNRTIAVSGETVGQVFVLRLVQDATGSRTVTWFSTIKWEDNTAPTLTTTANKTDTFVFIVTSAGNYDGYVLGQNL